MIFQPTKKVIKRFLAKWQLFDLAKAFNEDFFQIKLDKIILEMRESYYSRTVIKKSIIMYAFYFIYLFKDYCFVAFYFNNSFQLSPNQILAKYCVNIHHISFWFGTIEYFRTGKLESFDYNSSQAACGSVLQIPGSGSDPQKNQIRI